MKILKWILVILLVISTGFFIEVIYYAFSNPELTQRQLFFDRWYAFLLIAVTSVSIKFIKE